MAESDSVGSAWLGVVIVETQRVRKEGNWVGVYNVCIEVVFSLFCKPTNGTDQVLGTKTVSLERGYDYFFLKGFLVGETIWYIGFDF